MQPVAGLDTASAVASSLSRCVSVPRISVGRLPARTMAVPIADPLRDATARAVETGGDGAAGRSSCETPIGQGDAMIRLN